MKEKNNLEMKFDVYSKNYSQADFPLFKRWEKDQELDSLKDVEEYMKIFQYQKNPEDAYEILENIKQKGNSLVYTFRAVPARDSIAVKENLPTEYIQRKVIPKIELKNKLKKNKK